jgi:glycosyltransferase involved in cell wall biosynthesis
MVYRKNVCLLTETFYPVTGGGETQAKALVTGLAASGANVQVFSRRTDTALPSSDWLGSVRIWRLPPGGPGQHKKWGLMISAFLRLLRLARSYDVIIVCGFRVLGVPSMLAGRLLGKPCVLKADSLGELSGEVFKAGLERAGLSHTSRPFRIMIRLRNRVLLGATAFVAISSAVEEELMAYGVESRRINRIPNSVDTEIYSPPDVAMKLKLRNSLGIPADGNVAIYTGRLVTTKGLPLLLSVWKKLANRYQEARLLLVGSGGLGLQNCEQELREFVSRNSLDRSVIFTGSVENVHEYLQASDFFVFPSEREAFGISVIEAMACSLPVISTSAGGLSDIVSDEVTASVIPVGDHEALEQAIERALRGDDRLQDMATAGRKLVIDKYSQSSILSQYQSLLAGL